ncbi:GspH/FimT family pseudopilin [Chitinimonas naiadis]
MVMIVMATFFAVMSPRLFNVQQFSARGFADQLIANLRFAREMAIAQRAPIYVRVSSAQVDFCLDVACAQPATAADGSTPFRLSVPGGVGLATTASFSFDALGATSLSGNLQLSLTADVGQTVTIEAETGYVH